MDCKPMATPIVPNLKFLVDSYSIMVDPFMYRESVGSLLYMVNTKHGI
jgi:hypothetical protein